MSPSAEEYLRHMVEECDYLLETAASLTADEFIADETRKRAFVRSLEIIGEAAKKVPDRVREDLADIEWKSMAGMRDRLIHDYFGVDYELVWDVVQTRIPSLRESLDSYLNQRPPVVGDE